MSLEEIKELFIESFPYLYLSERRLTRALEECKIIEKRDNDKLIGISMIDKNSIALLCVKKEYQKKGIGSLLLSESEEYVKELGYKSISFCRGKVHFSTGVPSKSPEGKNIYSNIDIYDSLDDNALRFLKNRGYKNSWGTDDVFDMHMDLKDAKDDYKVNDTINGIKYEIATKEDYDEVLNCVKDACPEFVRFYEGDYLYQGKEHIVLIARDKDEIVGALNVGKDGDIQGSIGCTSVKHNHRHQGIATYLVMIGTKYLKDLGLKKGFLCFTNTGLDKLYGVAGYKICIFYFMAKKVLK